MMRQVIPNAMTPIIFTNLLPDAIFSYPGLVIVLSPWLSLQVDHRGQPYTLPAVNVGVYSLTNLAYDKLCSASLTRLAVVDALI